MTYQFRKEYQFLQGNNSDIDRLISATFTPYHWENCASSWTLGEAFLLMQSYCHVCMPSWMHTHCGPWLGLELIWEARRSLAELVTPGLWCDSQPKSCSLFVSVCVCWEWHWEWKLLHLLWLTELWRGHFESGLEALQKLHDFQRYRRLPGLITLAMENYVALACLCQWMHLWERPLAAMYKGKTQPMSSAVMDSWWSAALQSQLWSYCLWPCVESGFYSKWLEECWWWNGAGVLASHSVAVQQGGVWWCSSQSLQWWWGRQRLQSLLQEQAVCCLLLQGLFFQSEGSRSHLQHNRCSIGTSNQTRRHQSMLCLTWKLGWNHTATCNSFTETFSIS